MILMRVVGARPQFMQEVMFRREADACGHQEILVHTGQHYDERMSQVFFGELGIPLPDVNLGVGSGGHGHQTGRMLEALDDVIEEYRPGAMVVDGDTNSTLAGALSAAKLHVPVVHVEAGLRSFDRRMPEEVNRIVADHLGTLLCAPTRTAIANLEREGVADRAVLTGDLMYDCFLHFRTSADMRVLEQLELKPGSFLLATVHRAENTDDKERFQGIIRGLCSLPLPVVLPVHPRIRGQLARLLKTLPPSGNLKVIDPVSYLQMLALEQQAQCILTDSGGVQREAFFAGKPSVILRDTTEWREQVESGWSYVAGASSKEIFKGYEVLTSQTQTEQSDVYGDGQAAAKVIAAIEELLG
jgi:UDP-N-acetylglucosamine 2-epimerase